MVRRGSYAFLVVWEGGLELLLCREPRGSVCCTERPLPPCPTLLPEGSPWKPPNFWRGFVLVEMHTLPKGKCPPEV